jgi:two-component system, OmpR family, response regulator
MQVESTWPTRDDALSAVANTPVALHTPWGPQGLCTGLLWVAEPQVAQALAAALRLIGLQVVVANDLPHARRLAADIRADVVLCDLDADAQAAEWLHSLLQSGPGAPSPARSPGEPVPPSAGTMAVSALPPAGPVRWLHKPVATAAVVALVCEALCVSQHCAATAVPEAAERLSEAGVAAGAAAVARALGPDLMRLAPTERKLLFALAQVAPRLLRRDGIREAVWPGEAVSERVVDQYVKRLRLRLRQLGSPMAVTTVRGHGYRLDSPDALPPGRV